MSATEFVPNQNATEAVTAHVLWMTTGLSCDGDSVALTSATSPSLEDIITSAIPGMPKVVVHNPVIAYEVGEEFLEAWYQAERGELDPFVLVVEGSIPNEEINGEGHWTGLGNNPETGQPITTNEWLDRLVPKAAAVVAVGTCATYGGIPAMKNEAEAGIEDGDALNPHAMDPESVLRDMGFGLSDEVAGAVNGAVDLVVETVEGLCTSSR